MKRDTLKFHDERGIHMLLFALILFIFVGLLSLIIGVGLATSDRAKLQDAVNLAAFGALESFLRDSSSTATYASRSKSAQDTVQNVMSNLHLYSTGETFGNAYIVGAPAPSGANTTVQLGLWIAEAPSECSDEVRCCPDGNYPCFIPYSIDPASTTSSPHVNAIQVRVKSNSDRFIGTYLKNFALDATATVTLVQRCTAFLVDISRSSIYGNFFHSLYPTTSLHPGLTPYRRVDSPSPPSLFAFTSRAVDHGGPTGGTIDCALDAVDPDSLYWCNLSGSSRPATAPSAAASYRTDYKNFDTRLGQVKVNRYKDPEPLATFFKGFNAALRFLSGSSTSADKAMFIAFSDTIRDKIPDQGVTDNLDYLVQLTNLDNAGRVDRFGTWSQAPVHPNFVDRGWFPLFASNSNTNLELAFHTAIHELTTQCPAHSRKSIIVASDGIISEDYDRQTDTVIPLTSFGDFSNPASQPGTYVNAERNLLDTTYNRSTPTSNGVLGDLIAGQIKVTAIIAGGHVAPNFINYYSNTPYPHFLDFNEAMTHGYNALDPSPRFFSLTSYVPTTWPQQAYWTHCLNEVSPNDACAWRFAGELSSFFFLRPNGVLGQLVFKTGGIMCPIMPLDTNATHYWDDDSDPNTPEKLKDEYRTYGGTQLAAVEKLDSGSYAARCARDTVGLNPYILIDPSAHKSSAE